MVQQIERYSGGVEKFHEALPTAAGFHFVDDDPRLRIDFQPRPEDHVRTAGTGLMNLGRQHVGAVDEPRRGSGDCPQLLGGITHDPRGGLVPCPANRIADSAEQLPIEVVGNSVIHDLVKDHRRPKRISRESEGLSKEIGDRAASPEG